MILGCWLLLVPAASAEQYYVALGDSLAAGQTPNRMIDAGYADFIAQRLASQRQLTHFTKQLAFSGFTTAQVLERVQEPLAQPDLQKATLITISAGANDLLGLVSADAATGEVRFDQLAADFALNEVRKNMQLIFDELATRAPQATVYVMGYYFPYPYVHDVQKEGLMRQQDILNAILQQVATANDAIFVDVATSFNKQAVTYLPNAADVHPNFEGYRVMANAFLRAYGAPELRSEELPQPNPLTFEEVLTQLTEQTEQQREPIAQQQTTVERYAMPHGYYALQRLYVVVR